jgi:chromate transporter
MSQLWDLFSQFFLLAFIAFGGASALLPELHRVVVENHHWMDSTTFTQIFAIAQAAPGPNVLVVTLIGWEVAGVPGAIAATLGMCLPMSVLIYLLFGRWEQFRDARWRKAIQQGVAPLSVGLIVSSGVLIARAVSETSGSVEVWRGLLPMVMLVVATVLFNIRTSLHPLWLIAGGALTGVVVWGV